MNRTVRLNNRFGLHMRPAAEVARIAGAYEAEITIVVEENRANARSVFELLILGAAHGQLLELWAEGHDADAALSELAGFLDSYCDREMRPIMHGREGIDSSAA